MCIAKSLFQSHFQKLFSFGEKKSSKSMISIIGETFMCIATCKSLFQSHF